MAGFISLADAKAQMRVTEVAEDALIQRMIDAASRQVQRITGFIAEARTETFRFDNFDRQLELRLRPVAIDTISIKYLDEVGEWQEFTDVHAAEKNGTVRLAPALGGSWPSTACVPSAVEVTATVGFTNTPLDGAVDAPDDVKHAVRLCVASWYADREQGAFPQVALDLLDDDRMWRV
jgi:uncharacterized phiE125 gp8 family phage protein